MTSSTSDALPDGGIYQLLIHVAAPLELTVGALGRQSLVAGWYVYTGSMRRGLAHRLRRHRAVTKPLRWHIDYLTVAAPVVAVRWWAWRDGGQECATHRWLVSQPGVSEPLAGFGSSDCRCRTHLGYLGADRAVWDVTANRLGC